MLQLPLICVQDRNHEPPSEWTVEGYARLLLQGRRFMSDLLKAGITRQPRRIVVACV